MKKLIILHDFKSNQKVTKKINKQIFTGVITDSICASEYNFSKIPLKYRKFIPVKWNDGSKGAVYFKELKKAN